MRLFVVLFVSLALTLGATFSSGLTGGSKETVVAFQMPSDIHTSMGTAAGPAHGQHVIAAAAGPKASPPCDQCESDAGVERICDLLSFASCPIGITAPMPEIALPQTNPSHGRRMRRAIADRRLRGAGPAPHITPPRFSS